MLPFWLRNGIDWEDRMPALTLKKIPPELYERLKASARRHRRSLNQEALACFEKALMAERVDPATFLARARALRNRLDRVRLTDAALAEARREGRP